MDADDSSVLPANRAFVVRFRAAPPDRFLSEGRVEHISSGRTIRFHSSDELKAFFERMLRAASLEESSEPE